MPGSFVGGAATNFIGAQMRMPAGLQAADEILVAGAGVPPSDYTQLASWRLYSYRKRAVGNEQSFTGGPVTALGLYRGLGTFLGASGDHDFIPDDGTITVTVPALNLSAQVDLIVAAVAMQSTIGCTPRVPLVMDFHGEVNWLHAWAIPGDLDTRFDMKNSGNPSQVWFEAYAYEAADVSGPMWI